MVSSPQKKRHVLYVIHLAGPTVLDLSIMLWCNTEWISRTWPGACCVSECGAPSQVDLLGRDTMQITHPFCKLMRGTRETHDSRTQWQIDRQYTVDVCSEATLQLSQLPSLSHNPSLHLSLSYTANWGTIRYYFHHPSIAYMQMFLWNLRIEFPLGTSYVRV